MRSRQIFLKAISRLLRTKFYSDNSDNWLDSLSLGFYGLSNFVDIKDCSHFMKLFKTFIFAFSLALVALFGGHDRAQAQMAGAGMANFMPKGAWNVQPALGTQNQPLSGVKMPCMMMAEYDNGYVVRLSGGGGKFLAMALDVRQKAFSQGRKYNATLSLNNGFNKNLQGTAFSESVLIFNVRPFAGLYGALMNASNMTMNIEGNVFGFGLGSLQSAVNGLEACYGGTPPMNMPITATMASAMPPTNMANMGAVPSPAPVALTPNVSGADRPQWGRKISKSSALPVQKRPAFRLPFMDAKPNSVGNVDVAPNPTIPSPVVAPSASVGTAMKMGPRSTQPSNQNAAWTAKAGDDIRATLERWSSRAGIALDWQAGMGGKVAQNFNINGSFSDAVQALMAQNAAATGLDASMRGGTMPPVGLSAPMPITPAMSPMSPAMPVVASGNMMPPPPAMGVTSPAKWHAATGNSLEQALENWARKEGVELVWQANTGFGVKRTVHSNGAFTDALQEILSQYQSDNVRPMAQLNNDPVTGKRTLFVQSTRI